MGLTENFNGLVELLLFGAVPLQFGVACAAECKLRVPLFGPFGWDA